jgi:hypothetical protein
MSVLVANAKSPDLRPGGVDIATAGGDVTRLGIVMAGLDPAIHVLANSQKDVDARHKAGHDGLKRSWIP